MNGNGNTLRQFSTPAPSVVDEDICTGCRQCALDCPYDAITMIGFGTGSTCRHVLRDVTLEVEQGEFVALAHRRPP